MSALITEFTKIKKGKTDNLYEISPSKIRTCEFGDDNEEF